MKPLLIAAGAALLCSASLIACSPAPSAPPLDRAAVKADLQAVAQARVLFAHQSVGRNILQGVQAWSNELGVPLRIQQIDAAPPDAGPGIFHRLVGVNGDPQSKLQAFVALLDHAQQPAYDVAVLKFCYEDLGRHAHGGEGLLERYSDSMAAAQASRPRVRLLPATMPLRADPPGWRTRIKRWLGRDTEEDADNRLRNAYNDGVRHRFGAALFDIAAVESTLPDGSRSSFSVQGQPVYTLAAEYTSDGGHLNEEGRRRAAAAFLHALVQALRAPVPAGATAAPHG